MVQRPKPAESGAMSQGGGGDGDAGHRRRPEGKHEGGEGSKPGEGRAVSPAEEGVWITKHPGMLRPADVAVGISNPMMLVLVSGEVSCVMWSAKTCAEKEHSL